MVSLVGGPSALTSPTGQLLPEVRPVRTAAVRKGAEAGAGRRRVFGFSPENFAECCSQARVQSSHKLLLPDCAIQTFLQIDSKYSLRVIKYN